MRQIHIHSCILMKKSTNNLFIAAHEKVKLLIFDIKIALFLRILLFSKEKLICLFKFSSQ